MSKSPDELVEVAWGLVEEALTQGTITQMRDGQPNRTVISTDEIMALAKFLATLKIKKPALVSTPEDFTLKSTQVENEEED